MKKPRAASPVESATARVVFPLKDDFALTICNWRKEVKKKYFNATAIANFFSYI